MVNTRSSSIENNQQQNDQSHELNNGNNHQNRTQISVNQLFNGQQRQNDNPNDSNNDDEFTDTLNDLENGASRGEGNQQQATDIVELSKAMKELQSQNIKMSKILDKLGANMCRLNERIETVVSNEELYDDRGSIISTGQHVNEQSNSITSDVPASELDKLPDRVIDKIKLIATIVCRFEEKNSQFTTWACTFKSAIESQGVGCFLDCDMLSKWPCVQKVEALNKDLCLILRSRLHTNLTVKLDGIEENVYNYWIALHKWYNVSKDKDLEKAYFVVMNTSLSGKSILEYIGKYQRALAEIKKQKVTLDDFIKWSFMNNLGSSGTYVRLKLRDNMSKLSVEELMGEVSKNIELNSNGQRRHGGVFQTSQRKRSNAVSNESSNNQQSNKDDVELNVSKKGKINNIYSQFKMSQDVKEKYSNHTCEYCGRIGHPKSYCWKLARESAKNQHTENKSLMVKCDAKIDLRHQWIYDTGTSVHICNDESWFIQPIRRAKRIFRTSDDNSYLEAVGIGTVKLKMKTGQVFVLENVYHCPNAVNNLMTNVGLNEELEFIVDHKGVRASFEIKGKRTVIQFAKIVGGQNVICVEPLPVLAVTRMNQQESIIKPTEPEPEMAKEGVIRRGRGRPRKRKRGRRKNDKTDNVNKEIESKLEEVCSSEFDQFDNQLSQTEVDALNRELVKEFVNSTNDYKPCSNSQGNETWLEVAKRIGLKSALDVHLYTGHSGIEATRRMCNLFGIEGKSFNCDFCKKNNVRLNFGKHLSLNESSEVLQVVHMDLCQPYGNLTAFDGSKYVLTILDDYSKYLCVYLLENKSDAFIKFKQYLNYAERQHNVKLKEIRTDNGREFVNNEFELFLEEYGIRHSLTVPHIHQQNGSIERANRTLEERVYKLIDYLKMPKKYWSEAVVYAADQYNRTVNTHGNVPYTVWSKRIDDRKSFDFGRCVIYARPRENHRIDRGTGWFMGWSSRRKAYRVLPEKGNFVLDDVYFIRASDKKKSCVQTDNEEEDLPFVLQVSNAEHVPSRYQDIFNLDEHNRCRWFAAVKDELNSMIKKDVFEIIDKASVKDKIIGTQYVFTIKEGEPRARLVARGDWQSVESFSETYAPTIKLSMLMLLLKIAINRNLKVFSYDVKKAFLNAKLEDDVYIHLPDGFHLLNDNFNSREHCVKLNKALYGLKQAGRAWYLEITKNLKQYGFIPLKREATLFVHKDIQELKVAVYVDDMVVLCKNEKDAKDLFEHLTKTYEIHNRGELDKILGIYVRRKSNCFELDVKEMIVNLAKRYGIEPEERVHTPLAANEIVELRENGVDADVNEYSTLLGSLLYIARMVRPDILASVVQLCQFQQNCKKYHLKRAKRVLNYLINTIDYKIVIHKTEHLELEVYSDASVGNFYDSKSQLGCVIKLGSSTISYQSKKSPLVTMSANESEVVAASEALRELLYFKRIYCALEHGKGEEPEDCDLCKPVKLFVDNTGVEVFSERGFNKRTKYLDIRYYAIVDYARKGEIMVDHVNTAKNCADIFTKNQNLDGLVNGRALVNLELVNDVQIVPSVLDVNVSCELDVCIKDPVDPVDDGVSSNN